MAAARNSKKKKKLRLQLGKRTMLATAGMAAASFIRTWMRTLDYQVRFYDPSVDPVHPFHDQRKIYIFWHEYILFPLYLRGHCNMSMLISQHRDADVLTRLAQHFGFGLVRGSTKRGGAAAIKQLQLRAQNQSITLTPDGPRGPRRQCAPGAIYLASKMQRPLVLMGFGYDRPWRINSWDRFAVPRPGSRGRAIVSGEIHLPPDLDRGGIEHYQQEITALLNRLCDDAEDWAVSGRRYADQQEILRRGRRRRPWDANVQLPAEIGVKPTAAEPLSRAA